MSVTGKSTWTCLFLSSRAFVFGSGRHVTARAHTLREFVAALRTSTRPGPMDISAAAIFHDGSAMCLAIMPSRASFVSHERWQGKKESREALDHIVAAIRSRYDLTDESDLATVPESRPATT